MRAFLIASSWLLLLASLVAGPALRAQAPAPQPPATGAALQAPDYRVLEMLTKNAIAAGVNSIDHGIFLDDEACTRMADQGIFLVPSFGPFVYYEFKRIAEPWRPYRTVASWYVWRHLDPVTGGG